MASNGNGEPAKQDDYEASRATWSAAHARYSEMRAKYHAREIGDDAYLVERAAYYAAMEAIDRAEVAR